MSVAEVMRRYGGCASRAQLRQHLDRAEIALAVRHGSIVRLSRGRYALPTAAEHRREAHQRTAVLSHLSAAMAYGWAVKTVPATPWMTVPRKRRVRGPDRAGVIIVWRDLTERERRLGLTSPTRTVLDCAKRLPFDEALAVADSALRSGDVTRRELVAAAAALRGPGSREARQVAAAADGRSANPFESVLRAITLEVPDLTFVPQVQIAERGVWATVDLADAEARVAIEAEGFENHGTRRALFRDCRRYTELAVWGWTVLRFTWVDVMHDREYVLWALRSLVARRAGAPDLPAPPARQAVPYAAPSLRA